MSPKQTLEEANKKYLEKIIPLFRKYITIKVLEKLTATPKEAERKESNG